VRKVMGCLLVGSMFAAACSGLDRADVERESSVASPTETELSAPSVPVDPPANSSIETEPSAPEPPTTEQPEFESERLEPVPSETVGADNAGDSLYPLMGNGGYDVVNYLLELDVDVESNELEATATITATTTQDLSQFNFDLHSLEVASVLVNGELAEFERDGDELVVTSPVTLVSNTDFTVVVAYSGTPQGVSDPGVPFAILGWQNDEGTVYVVSEPSGAMSWYPSNNHPSDKATFEFVITHDAELTAVANGVQQRIESDGGTSTTTWLMDDPMTTYLAAIYVGDFELRESVTDDGLRLRNYFPPAFADDLEQDFELTADVIDFYEDLFGADYPFDEYGSIVLPFNIGFALENQTISVHGLDTTDEGIIAHEILHQWAGNSVTVADWQDIWMLEGFATYLSYMYFEDRGLNADVDPRGMYAVLEEADAGGPAEVSIEDLFGVSVYFRGGLALHALRIEIGEDDFVEILRTYYERNSGEAVSTAEFQQVVADVSGEGAVDVLNDWLFGTDLPPFPT
jgi:aminopeptidase N